jgi:hypothetical protein
MMKYLACIFFAMALSACNKPQHWPYTTFGSIEKTDTALDKLIKPGAKIEIIAEGFTWSEGPVWDEKDQMLLFSDITTNINGPKKKAVRYI